MLLVGLTGGIASGKTLVSDTFASLGAPVIDADLLAREVVAPGSPGLAELVRVFSADILTADGELDRKALRQIIFQDAGQRARVDAILHPRIRELSDTRIQKEQHRQSAYCVYAVPLLVETDQQSRFDRIVVVDVPEGVQVTRLMARDNTTREAAEAILDAQASREQRLAIADHIIDNSGPVAHTQEQVATLHNQLMDAANAV